MSADVDTSKSRERMVTEQIEARGIVDPSVLRAMRTVRREGYVPSYLGEFAYEDSPLPIEEEQTISQPHIVAYMVEALELGEEDRVLEVGTGSGYAAAVLAEIAREVYTIERHASLAQEAADRLRRDGYRNVHVRLGDGTLGWPEAAPFDAIVVAAGGPEVPASLRQQLAIGGRLVMPVGEVVGYQKLIRVRRVGEDEFRTEDLVDVRFVPLVGEEGWHEEGPAAPPQPRRTTLAEEVRSVVEPFRMGPTLDLGGLLERIGDSRVVLLGEASHGTAEFYSMRAEITRALIQEKDFQVVAVEADWPDAARIDHYVRERDVPAAEWEAFARFPTWMWRNRQVREFVDWLRSHNQNLQPECRVRFAGLDLYAMYNSIAAVLQFLDERDPELARSARQRYACLEPWQHDPAGYGRAVLSGTYRSCETEAVDMLKGLLAKRNELSRQDGDHAFDAILNGLSIADAESYYRVMYYGSAQSWNLRDRHMFQTLQQLLRFHGPQAKAVIWAHNSHLGDASATEMAARGEINVGQLCRQRFGSACYSVGFGTDHGEVAAASTWGGPLEIKRVRPALEESYERVCHDTALESFFLPLRYGLGSELRGALSEPRLERAIGVIYRPETERASHYFHAVLPSQFDEFVWFDETRAVDALASHELAGVPETYPFGL